MAMTFNRWIIDAIAWTDRNHGGKGYGDAAFTHDLPYDGQPAQIKATRPPKTMCVAAQAELILTALSLCYDDLVARGDSDPLRLYRKLPKASWLGGKAKDIRTWLWMNTKGAYGAGFTFRQFGIGDLVAFDRIKPGDFINFNCKRRNADGTFVRDAKGNILWAGHAVVFENYVDSDGNYSTAYSSNVVGFQFYSSQTGGMGRAVTIDDKLFGRFNYKTKPPHPFYHWWFVSEKPEIFNCGTLYHPDDWRVPVALAGAAVPTGGGGAPPMAVAASRAATPSSDQKPTAKLTARASRYRLDARALQLAKKLRAY